MMNKYLVGILQTLTPTAKSQTKLKIFFLIFDSVKVLKTVISVLLLSVYVLGFGHSLTPHCQTNCDNHFVAEKTHVHDHHEHGSDEVNGHDHVIHGDHFDNNWIDLLVCLLSDVEHNNSGCHAPHFIQADNRVEKKSWSKTIDDNQNELVAKGDLPISFELRLVKTSIKSNAPPHVDYSFLHFEDSPLRGPPFYSC